MRGAGCKDTGRRRLQQNPRFFRIQNPGGPHPSTMQFPHLLGDSVCCGRIQNARRTVQHAVSTPFGGFCMLRQNTECAPDRPTYSFHAFCGILYAAAEYRMRAGPSNIQFPRLLRDSVCCGRMQNAGRRMQDTGLQQNPRIRGQRQNTEYRPADSISPPATTPHRLSRHTGHSCGWRDAYAWRSNARRGLSQRALRSRSFEALSDLPQVGTRPLRESP